MNKHLLAGLIFFSSCTAYASSVIELPVSHEIPPAGNVTISLNPLIKRAEYDVACHLINNNTDKMDIHFALDMQKETRRSAFILNDKRLTNDQGQLNSGDNIAMLRVSTKENGNTIIISNLDRHLSVQVSDCSAKPSVRKLGAESGLLDYYYAYNDTDKTFDISVGYWLPVTKTITPHSWVTIWDTGSETHIKNLR